METKEKKIPPTALSVKTPMGKNSIQFQLNRAPSGQGFGYPPSETVPLQCEILFIPEAEDDKGNKLGYGDWSKRRNRRIAYMPGAKSVFVDEWEEHEKEKLEVRKNLDPIRFTLGFLTVSANEVNKLHYLQICDYNAANEATRLGSNVIFKEVDYEALAQKVVEQDNILVKAKYFVNEFPIEEVRIFAIATAETKKEADDYREMEEFTLRYKMRAKAQRTPKLFAERMLSGKSKYKAAIYRALTKGIIVVDDNETELGWSSNNESIIEAPQGVNVIEHLADLASKNDDFKGIVAKITELTTTDKKVEEKPKVDWISALIEQAEENKVIQASGNFYFIQNGEDKPIKVGVKEIRDKILTNKDDIMTIISSQLASEPA